MKEIAITDIETIRIGQAEDAVGGTGCTVFLSENGMAAGIDIRGGGPAGRDNDLAQPLTAAQTIHAVLLSGGSAFGLDAAGGVQQYLEERGIGYEVGVTKVPLVCQSDIFDLAVGDAHARPDRSMGYAAAAAAMAGGNYRDGCFGVGCGATVGKLYGVERAMKSGVGSFAYQLGELKVGAVVVVNAFGDIFDTRTGQQIAGLLNETRDGLASTMDAFYATVTGIENKFTGNTTLGVVITNAKLDKTRLCKLAGMAHDGYARSIRPVHTSADGDTIYALSVGDVETDPDLVGALAADAVSEAITRAVLSAHAAFGLPCAADLRAKSGR